MHCRMIHAKKAASCFLLLIFMLAAASPVLAQTRNLTVTIIGPETYSDIWLGISTGGYDILAEKGKELQFRVFVKNGMADRSLHNLKIIPSDFPFEIESIIPKQIEQLKPMEIVIFWVNTTVPLDAQTGRHRYAFDVSSDEFPIGVFSLQDDIRVVDRINVERYVLYVVLSIAVLALLFYRKWKIAKQGKLHAKKR